MSCDFTNTNLTDARCNFGLLNGDHNHYPHQQKGYKQQYFSESIHCSRRLFFPGFFGLMLAANHPFQHQTVMPETLFVSALVGWCLVPIVFQVFAAVLAGETGIHARGLSISRMTLHAGSQNRWTVSVEPLRFLAMRISSLFRCWSNAAVFSRSSSKFWRSM